MRRFWTALLIAAALAVAGFVVFRQRSPAWTSDSPEALAEFRRGLDAEMKYYHQEALAHYRRAAELDPDFAMATVKALAFTPRSEKEEVERLKAALAEIDTSRLTPRERLLVEFRTARQAKENSKAQRLLEAYLAERPDDPYVLSIQCDQLWDRRDWAAAEQCNRKLIKADPNWVRAQNHLGYLAMAQGKFAEAEELFRTYLYVAPDQANPHDSMGELLTLVGRYAEAEKELEEAVRIKPDFCASWHHMLDNAFLEGKPEKAAAIVGRVEELEACDRPIIDALACRAGLWSALQGGDLEAAWGAAQSPRCPQGRGEVPVLVHRIALLTGRLAEADEMEAMVRKEAELHKDEPFYPAFLAHLRGLRQMVTGQVEEAATSFREADDRLVYWGDGQGIFKLFNRLDLAHALAAAGDQPTSAEVRAEIQQVNPHFFVRFQDHALGRLHASRGGRSGV